MILIRKNTANNAYLTLSEKTTLDPVYYLFEVINDTSNEVIYFIAEDISTNKERGNQFVITDDSVEDPLAGVVNFPLEGFYKYKVYEQSSQTNLDPTGLSEVDRGKLRVVDVAASDTIYEGETLTNTIYNG